MTQIPETWPPSPPRVVPLFPLPGVCLFPGMLVPLHISETRYEQMIEDSLDGPGRIALGTVVEGHESELEGSPPFHTVAGLGEIARHERSDDGHFGVWLYGLERVHVNEVPSERLYRQVEVVSAIEIQPDPETERELRSRLEDALRVRHPELQAIPTDAPVGHLTDLLLSLLDLPHSLNRELFATLEIDRRAQAALARHESRPPEPSEDE